MLPPRPHPSPSLCLWANQTTRLTAHLNATKISIADIWPNQNKERDILWVELVGRTTAKIQWIGLKALAVTRQVKCFPLHDKVNTSTDFLNDLTNSMSKRVTKGITRVALELAQGSHTNSTLPSCLLNLLNC